MALTRGGGERRRRARGNPRIGKVKADQVAWNYKWVEDLRHEQQRSGANSIMGG